MQALIRSMSNLLTMTNNGTYKIGDICDVKTGKKDVNAENVDGKYPFFTCAQGIHKINTYTFDDEAVLVAGNGFFNVKYYKGKFDAYQRTYVLHNFKSNIRGKYLYYFINHRLDDITKDNRGSTIRYIRLGDITEQQVSLPPIEQQDKAIELLDQAIQEISLGSEKVSKSRLLVQKFKQAILSAAVTGKLTENWRAKNYDDDTYQDFNLENGEVIQIPALWERRAIGDFVLDIEAGKNFTCPEVPVSGNNVGIVKISAVTWGEFDEKETKTVEDESKIDEKLFINKEDFLISRANTIELVGASVVVGEVRHKIMLSDKVWRVNFEDINKEYVNYYLKSRIGRSEIEARATGNQQSMRNISQSNFKAINLPTPSDNEQAEIVRIVKQYLEIANQVEKQIEKAEARVSKLTQAILAKTFRQE